MRWTTLVLLLVGFLAAATLSGAAVADATYHYRFTGTGSVTMEGGQFDPVFVRHVQERVGRWLRDTDSHDVTVRWDMTRDGVGSLDIDRRAK